MRLLKIYSATICGLNYETLVFPPWLLPKAKVLLAITLILGLLVATKFLPNPLQLVANSDKGCGNQSNQSQPSTIVSNPSTETSTPINLSKTLNQVTITVKQVSADANQIAISVNTLGPGCFSYLPFNVTLKDVQGRNFSEMPGAFGAGGGDLLFDASDISDKLTELKLHLTIASIQKQKPEGGVELIPGPFSFDFNVPFNANQVRIAHLSHTDMAGSVSVILDKVVVSPSQTRFYLKGNLTTQIDYELTIGTTLISNDTRSENQAGNRSIVSSPQGLTIISLDVPLFDKQGEWSLVIRPHKTSSYINGGTPPTTIAGGPWVFRFEVLTSSN